uniref:PSI domain-containing protein n=1 Tax=Chromera velia CCMP2878 TaxID=1169474 RepID=A0A0G4HPW6_9ALVE|eukprot:Cvel_1236.t1-p1 / transcript=Cvel_1236.t1 / gene=Cvel_1236 / organism=Chromera_velia_CCMP2878 / gene_product=Multiple epidermal growth factor-like domains, putative / transcript_product=Multiple epidermal growth factor-like domains, putative / location=Cvel_scaffold41:77978-94821(-) / protein_length=1546 / sequence_SO=supercontig / SO=protein_coding / is_pseudo=false
MADLAEASTPTKEKGGGANDEGASSSHPVEGSDKGEPREKTRSEVDEEEKLEGGGASDTSEYDEQKEANSEQNEGSGQKEGGGGEEKGGEEEGGEREETEEEAKLRRQREPSYLPIQAPFATIEEWNEKESDDEEPPDDLEGLEDTDGQTLPRKAVKKKNAAATSSPAAEDRDIDPSSLSPIEGALFGEGKDENEIEEELIKSLGEPGAALRWRNILTKKLKDVCDKSPENRTERNLQLLVAFLKGVEFFKGKNQKEEHLIIHPEGQCDCDDRQLLRAARLEQENSYPCQKHSQGASDLGETPALALLQGRESSSVFFVKSGRLRLLRSLDAKAVRDGMRRRRSIVSCASPNSAMTSAVDPSGGSTVNVPQGGASSRLQGGSIAAGLASHGGGGAHPSISRTGSGGALGESAGGVSFSPQIANLMKKMEDEQEAEGEMGIESSKETGGEGREGSGPPSLLEEEDDMNLLKRRNSSSSSSSSKTQGGDDDGKSAKSAAGSAGRKSALAKGDLKKSRSRLTFKPTHDEFLFDDDEIKEEEANEKLESQEIQGTEVDLPTGRRAPEVKEKDIMVLQAGYVGPFECYGLREVFNGETAAFSLLADTSAEVLEINKQEFLRRISVNLLFVFYKNMPIFPTDESLLKALEQHDRLEEIQTCFQSNISESDASAAFRNSDPTQMEDDGRAGRLEAKLRGVCVSRDAPLLSPRMPPPAPGAPGSTSSSPTKRSAIYAKGWRSKTHTGAKTGMHTTRSLRESRPSPLTTVPNLLFQDLARFRVTDSRTLAEFARRAEAYEGKERLWPRGFRTSAKMYCPLMLAPSGEKTTVLPCEIAKEPKEQAEARRMSIAKQMSAMQVPSHMTLRGNTFGPKRDTGYTKDECWNFDRGMSMFGDDSCRTCSGSTCDECARSGKGCGWCAETGTCGPTSTFGEMCVNGKGSKCSNWQGCLSKEPNEKCPAVQCSKFDTCSSCAQNKGCGWCASSQTCIEGSNFVGLCKDCQDGISCFKPENDDYCPASQCSSFTMCTGCTAQKGCGWNAEELKCVELSKTGSGSCPSTSNGCLFQTQDQCPHTPTQRCAYWTTCKACAEDAACGWSSGTNECVEASTSGLGGCRGRGAFSYWDCEPHCDSLSDCGPCLAEETATCTWCVGERLNPNRTKVERCTLAKGAVGKNGFGDRRKTEYDTHSCDYTISEKGDCESCGSKGFKADLSDPFGKALKEKGSCSACVSDSKCVACEYETNLSGKVSDCVRGDEEGPYSACRVPADAMTSMSFNGFWSHKNPTMGPREDSEQCGNQDPCRTATTCGACMAPSMVDLFHCVWCNQTEPLSGQSSIGSRCRSRGECPTKFSTEERNKCPREPTCQETGEEGGCQACVARKDCAFIPSSNMCVPSNTPFSNNYLPYVWGDQKKCPDVCGRHDNCKDCSSDSNCGWCPLAGCLPLGRSKSPLTPGPDYLSTGRTCSPFVQSFSRRACKAAEKAEEEGGTGSDTGGKSGGKSGRDGGKSGGGGGFWIALGWTFFALVLFAFALFGLWWFFFRFRPSRGHAAPNVPLLSF